jgi:hypothetical protein
VTLSRKLLVAFAVGIMGGSSVLVLPAHVADLWAHPIVAHIPDPLPLPCPRQNWTNADRICLSWTAPRDDMRQTTVVAIDRDRSGAVAISRHHDFASAADY